MSQDFDAADQLFQICDLDGSGYVDEAELAQICKELPAEDLHEIFLELDKDQDGHISVEEFRRGFKEIYNNVKKRRLSSKTGDERAPQNCSVDDGVLDEFVGSFLLISLNGFDMVTNFTAVAATLNNIGPGLELVGPMQNFSGFADPAKLVLIFDMLAGRLEIFPMLVLFLPDTWRKF